MSAAAARFTRGLIELSSGSSGTSYQLFRSHNTMHQQQTLSRVAHPIHFNFCLYHCRLSPAFSVVPNMSVCVCVMRDADSILMLISLALFSFSVLPFYPL